jgi:hypothetical protein
MRIVNASFGHTRIGDCEREGGSARLRTQLRRMDFGLDNRRSEGDIAPLATADKRRSDPPGTDRPQGRNAFRV